jgi:hypothetical protein
VGRAIGAVVAGFLLWSVLWLGFGVAAQALLPDLVQAGQAPTHSAVLLAFVLFSVAISAPSGYVCAAVAGPGSPRAVWALAIVLLVVGIGVEAASWALTPVWYHLVFLALLVPATVWGGARRVGRS